MALSVGGCVQATRHSNTMVFGTNTVFGIEAGQSANSVPSVTVGYKRQEAVIMPLVANTEDDGTYQKPCELSDLPDYLLREIHPCLLVSRHGDSIDTYSVLASFGAKFSGSGTNATASGGLAQFFATGIAAQALALNGGAALVAVGEAAEQNHSEEAAAGIAALVGTPGARTRMVTILTDNKQARGEAMEYLASIDSVAFAKRFSAFAQALVADPDYCKDLAQDACLAKVKDRETIDAADAATLRKAMDAAKAVEAKP